MTRLTLEYWLDEDWYVGRLREIPNVMSQGETLKELQKNIRDAYHLVMEDARAKISLPRKRAKMLIAL